MAAVCLRCGREVAISGGSLLCADCQQAQPRVSVTAALIAINLLVFVVMAVGGVSVFAPGPEDLLRWGASYGPYDLADGWWRLFSSMFVHIGVIHIALNMYCLASLGPIAETIFGSARFLALYILSGVAGAIASAGVHPDIVSAGASGAIFGVAGALAAVIYVSRNPVMQRARGRLSKAGIGTFVIYNLIYGTADAGIDNAAHVGGLAAGFLMGLTLPVGRQSTAEPEPPLRAGLVLLATAVALVGGFLGVRQWRLSYAEVYLARQQMLGGNYAGGIERLQRVLRDDPHDVHARALLGAAYLDQDKPADAVRELELALRDDSVNRFALFNLGSAHWSLKEWEKAAAAYARASRVDPRDASAWSNLGGAFINGERPGDAIAPLERAIALQPDTARNHFNLGLAYSRTERYAAAVKSFSRALQLSPDNPLALLERGYAYAQLRQLDSARADYRRVLNAPPGAASDATRRDARRLLSELRGR